MVDRRLTPEELIALRDGLATTGKLRRDAAGDPASIRELTESRLFALLMSLPVDGAADRRGPVPPPEQLVRYLCNALPQAELQAVEAAVRGNTTALDLLLALKDALFRANVWRSQPEVPTPPATPMTRLGDVRVAVLDGQLRFSRQEDSLVGAVEADVSLRLAPEAARAEQLEMRDRPALRESSAERLDRIIRDLRSEVRKFDRTIDALSSSLLMARKLGRSPLGALDDGVASVRRNVAAIEAGLRELEEAARGSVSDDREAAFRAELERTLLAYRRAEASEAARRDPRLDWPTALTVSDGDVAVELFSAKQPTPAIGIRLRGLPTSPAPEATLVEEGRRFEVLAAVGAGEFIAPWASKPLLLLIDTERTYCVRLAPA